MLLEKESVRWAGPQGLRVEAYHLSRHLAEFLREAWHVVEPSTPLMWGRHLDAICEHLEAVKRGDIRNLLITIPPGCTKSIACSVVYPAWVWSSQPGERFLTGSNEGELSLRDAVACRRLVESEWYRERWGDQFRLTTDQNVKGWYENTRRGFRTATTVGSRVTGKKGGTLILDDPNDAAKAGSEAESRAVREWWSKSFYNRVNHPRNARRIVIGQRTGVDDLQQLIIDGGAFDHLNLPEEYDPETRYKTAIGEDWRTERGELLRPERFGPVEIAETIKVMGARGYLTQHNQKALPEDGEMFKRSWFEIVQAAPANAARCRAWDKGASAGKGDPSAGVLFAREPGGPFFIEDVITGQWSAGERNDIMLQTAAIDKTRCKQYDIELEQEPGSGGKESAEYSVRQLAGYNVHVNLPNTGDKTFRARPMAIQAEAKNIKIVAGPWNKKFLDELTGFPFGAHDDQVDAAVYAFNRMALMRKLTAWIQAGPTRTG